MPLVPLITPLGVGDLKVVKMRLARYEAGDLAHVENVMAREKRQRKHRRLRQYEETLELEESREEESKRDLQSTERFEIQSESKKTISSKTSFESGIEISAGYGPVELSASAKFATEGSVEESDTQSTKYAKEITEETITRLVEKVRELRKTRTLDEVEETNRHGFDNTAGEEHVTGVYRWLDKYYRAKVVNYGKRLMYEFMVPEPAYFYLYATKYNYENKVLPQKPEVPVVPYTSTPLYPAGISRSNYLSLVEQYSVEGVTPPPPRQVVISKAISRELQSDHWAFSNEELKVPKGYTARNGVYSVWYTWKGDGDLCGNLLVGINRIGIGHYPSLSFQGESDIVPISGTGYDIKSFALNIEAVCDLLPEMYQKWQIDTYNSVMTAYQKALMDYDEAVAAAQIQQGVQIGGDNPELNRQTEEEELKKSCLSLWTLFQFNNPASVTSGEPPELILGNALLTAKWIRYFEEAFEWENIAYEFYPYFWGRKSQWVDMYSLESSDPVFEKFLKAGAARVCVPVTPSHTAQVLYYQLTGELVDKDAVPSLATFTDPYALLYNSYIEEMEGVEDLPDIEQDIEIAVDDPDSWLMKVPTTLVWLQEDRTLPDFEAV
jgi:hypothetical protein